MFLLKRIFMGAVALALLVPAAAHAVSINEIRIDNPGADTDEYFELAGMPGMALDGYTYIVIGDGAGGSGVIESVTDLTGQMIQADGLLAVHKAGTTGVCSGYDVDLTLSFENSDNVTHMLVAGFTGANGDDLDVDDDGVLDSMPWSYIVDWVSIVETPTTGDKYYSPRTVGPDGSYVPGQILICDGYWVVGGFTLCAFDTPGMDNASSCAVDNEATSFGSLKSMFR